MRESLYEVRRKPEVVGAELAIVFTFAQRRIGKRLTISVDEFVFLQLVVELVRLEQRDWMFQPERNIRDCLDLVRGFQHPAFTPAVNDAIVGRVSGKKSERNLEDDRVDIDSRLAISAVVDKNKVAVFIFEKLVAIPREVSRRQLSLITVVSPLRIIRIAIEQVIAFELNQGFGNVQLAAVRHG